jgi:hypothetical protein
MLGSDPLPLFVTASLCLLLGFIEVCSCLLYQTLVCVPVCTKPRTDGVILQPAAVHECHCTFARSKKALCLYFLPVIG